MKLQPKQPKSKEISYFILRLFSLHFVEKSFWQHETDLYLKVEFSQGLSNCSSLYLLSKVFIVLSIQWFKYIFLFFRNK